MRANTRSIIVAATLCALCSVGSALAAPERLGDWVPDATPDEKGALSFSYNRLQMDLEGGVTGERTAHDFFKLRYTFSPKVAATLRYGRHDLAGGAGLLSPVFDLKDSAESYEFDLGINLMNVAPTPADAAKNQAWAAGSSFGIGLSGTQYQLAAGSVDQDQTLLKAYMVYSTDLSEELRAHTVFSSARLSGDSQSGSANRVGAGLDYTLITGEHPLTLMANGIIDIYNFRQPSFNTSRISRFDIGLRYRVARDWYATLGWVTANDSESDTSGSGIFAGINFVDEPPPPCPVPAEPVPAEAAPAAAAEAMQTVASAGAAPLMAVAPAAGTAAGYTDDPLDDFREQVLGEMQTSRAVSSADAPTSLETELAAFDPANDYTLAPRPDTTSSTDATATSGTADKGTAAGVSIPSFPMIIPLPTSETAVMVRAGYQPEARHQTRAGDAIARPPTGPYLDLSTSAVTELAFSGTEQLPVADAADPDLSDATAEPPAGLIASNQAGAVAQRSVLAPANPQQSGEADVDSNGQPTKDRASSAADGSEG